MQAFRRALEADRAGGLPVPWRDLALKLWIPRGSMVIMFGAPGSLKSMIAVAWALGIGEPARLISLDTDPLTQAARIIANQSGRATDEVLGDPGVWSEWLTDRRLPILALDEPVSALEVEEVIRADIEYWGRPPALVVVDDVSKLKMETRDYTGYDTAMLELHRAARKHETTVLAIHHLNRGEGSSKINRARKPQMADGKFTGEYEAPIVLGAWRPIEDRVRISVLKNRFGPDDPRGGMYTELVAEPWRARVREPTDLETARWVVGQ